MLPIAAMEARDSRICSARYICASLLKTYLTPLSKEVQRSGLDGLIKALNSKYRRVWKPGLLPQGGKVAHTVRVLRRIPSRIPHEVSGGR